MTEVSLEHAAEARAALSAIVTDPDHGVAALSSVQTMSNLLKDLLPDAPREKSLLVAAAEAGLATKLREHVEQGLDPSSAIRLAASSLSISAPFTPEACSWVTREIAAAMGINAQPTGGVFSQAATPHGPAPTAAGQASGQAPGQGFQAQGSGRAAAHAPVQGFGQAPAQAPVHAFGQSPWQGPGQSPAQGHGLGRGQAAASGQGTPQAYRTIFPPPPGPGYSPATPAGYRAGATPTFQPMAGYQPAKKNGLAVTSLVCGIAQFVLWFAYLVPGLIAAIMAIVFGAVALRQIGRTREAGRGMAIAGIICAAVGILLVTLFAIIGYAVEGTGN